MINRHLLRLAPILFLPGCSIGSNSAGVMVDLAGGVFLIFTALVALKYITPKLLRNPYFDLLIQYLEKNISSFIKPLYGVSFLLILYGLLSPTFTDNTLDKILVFPGFVLLVIARNLTILAISSHIEERKRSLEIISLGFSVTAVLFMLWVMGDEMFAPFTSWF